MTYDVHTTNIYGQRKSLGHDNPFRKHYVMGRGRRLWGVVINNLCNINNNSEQQSIKRRKDVDKELSVGRFPVTGL